MLPDFLRATSPTSARGDWRIAPVPADLQDRRVEITGPVDRKMIINALNAPVRCFMADFEDSCAPTLGEHRPRAGQPARCRPPHDQLRGSGDRQGLSPRGPDGDPHRAPARLASAGEARSRERGGGLGRAVRFRGVPRQQPRGARARAAPARISICRRWRVISRRGCGTTCSSPPRTRSACRAAPSRRRC